MRAMHQKNLLEPDFPFSLGEANNLEFPPHWHEEIEIVYMIEGNMQVGLDNKTYLLKPRDIFLIGRGDVHHFTPHTEPNQSIIIQFGLSFFSTLPSYMVDGRFVEPLLNAGVPAHKAMEGQILTMVNEYKEKEEGHEMALKARLFDLMVILVREIPMEPFSAREKNRQLSRLKRLDRVLEYIDENYDQKMGLEDVAAVANYSPYHFTRFFKDTTGMTFSEYLNSVRVKKAEGYLLDIDSPITEVAFKSGFNSIQTFNRVFKINKGCTPTEYREKQHR